MNIASTQDQQGLLRLSFSWPSMPSNTGVEEVFWGAWHPTNSIEVHMSAAPRGVVYAQCIKKNFVMFATRPEFGRDHGILTIPPDESQSEHSAIAFRGYTTNPFLNTRTHPERMLERFGKWDNSKPNGVFAAASINRGGAQLSLMTDAFGIAPLYWTTLQNGIVLFATSQRFLRCSASDLEPIAMRAVFARGSVTGDLSLVPGVRRVSPGCTEIFEATGRRTERWFSFGSLPQGEDMFSNAALEEFEGAFQTAIDRCLEASVDYHTYLPLSGGDDSRRILASLLHKRKSFSSATVRTLTKGNRDVDAQFAMQMAQRFDFPHRVFEYPSPSDYADDDQRARTLFGGEVSDHTWITPIIRALPNHSMALFDGLGGDVFGNTAYAIANLYELPHEQMRHEVMDMIVPGHIDRVLRTGAWSSGEEVQNAILNDLSFLPSTKIWSDFAFLLTRTRRSTGTWGQHLVPVGHLMLYPYFDLDFAIAALRIDPLAKISQTLQSRCLERFWPDFFSLPGSRREADLVRDQGPAVVNRLVLARIGRMREELGTRKTLSAYIEKLTPRAAFLSATAAVSEPLTLRIRWLIDPFLMLTVERDQAHQCWR